MCGAYEHPSMHGLYQYMCACLLQLLAGNTVGKVAGPPGNALDLVYPGLGSAVTKKLHQMDPVLAEYIRWHTGGILLFTQSCQIAIFPNDQAQVE